MKIILCVDDNMGMLFNSRRQSRDKKVIEDIFQMTSTLWIHPFSEKLFQEDTQMVVENNTKRIHIDQEFLKKAKEGEYCFVENQELISYCNVIEQIILYSWNKKYPSDFKLDLDLSKWKIREVAEFEGNSHEKITKTIYVPA